MQELRGAIRGQLFTVMTESIRGMQLVNQHLFILRKLHSFNTDRTDEKVLFCFYLVNTFFYHYLFVWTLKQGENGEKMVRVCCAAIYFV